MIGNTKKSMNLKCFICILCIVIIDCSSPRSSSTLPNLYKKHWEIVKTGIRMHDNVIQEHQTKSDAMQLYSIQAKQIVKVSEADGAVSWEPKYKLTVTSKKSRSRRDNKFVTETVSYQRLKIRSADNNKYLCAKTNGEIVFKDFADKEDRVANGSRALFLEKADKNNKPRKRCLFHWQFTDQMHIKLSLEAANKKRYYLSVKDDIISLREDKDSTELERSFIWLPTKSAPNRFRKHNANPIGRGFPLKDDKEQKKLQYCSMKDFVQQEKIRYLEAELIKLTEKLEKLQKLEEQMSDALDE